MRQRIVDYIREPLDGVAGLWRLGVTVTMPRCIEAQCCDVLRSEILENCTQRHSIQFKKLQLVAGR